MAQQGRFVGPRRPLPAQIGGDFALGLAQQVLFDPCHLGAAFQGGGPFTEDEFFAINAGGTFNVLETARRAGVQQVIYASTDALFPKYVPGGLMDPINESIAKKPVGSYSVTKSIGEDLCMAYWKNQRLPVTITRFAMIFGAGEVLHFPPLFIYIR